MTRPQSHESKFTFAPLLVTTDGRRAGFVWGSKPLCVNPKPHPHNLIRVTGDPILTETIATCDWKLDRGAPSCGALMYVRKIPRFSRQEAQVWIIVEITPEHVRRLREGPMLFIETLTILGCVLPGMELYLPKCRVCGKGIARHAAAAHEFDPEPV